MQCISYRLFRKPRWCSRSKIRQTAVWNTLFAQTIPHNEKFMSSRVPRFSCCCTVQTRCFLGSVLKLRNYPQQFEEHTDSSVTCRDAHPPSKCVPTNDTGLIPPRYLLRPRSEVFIPETSCKQKDYLSVSHLSIHISTLSVYRERHTSPGLAVHQSAHTPPLPVITPKPNDPTLGLISAPPQVRVLDAHVEVYRSPYEQRLRVSLPFFQDHETREESPYV